MTAALSDALALSSKLRVPVFERGTSPRQRIDAYEEHMMVSAYHSGDLAAERLDFYAQLKEKLHEWDHLEGWQVMQNTSRRSEKGVDDAKRQVNPELYDEIEDLRWRIARWTEEIDRLERDATKCSRAYTLIAGG